MIAVVTGASGGIGLEFCKNLAERGYTLVMISIDDTPLHNAAAAIAEAYHVATYPLTLDLCNDDACDRIFAYLENFNLSPDLLINNAGIFSFAPVIDIPERKIDAFLDLHVKATTHLSIRFAQYFKRCKSGRILNMSSMSCWMPMPGLAMYSSTKAYIRTFSRALHYEMRDYGVSVTVACPGGIATDLFGLPENLKRLALRLGAIQRPERFAQKAIDKTLKGKAQYINGFTNRLAIIFIGILPRKVRMMVKHQLLDRGIVKI